MITGQLGTPQSAPGAVQPGYFCRGTIVWKGPFSPAAAMLGAAAFRQIVTYGVATVTSAIASQLAAADPTWWEFH